MCLDVQVDVLFPVEDDWELGLSENQENINLPIFTLDNYTSVIIINFSFVIILIIHYFSRNLLQ